ncbi:hypothetical protein [Rhodobacter sp. 24-YEA-8]|uniref:hypothetical protein n=1 Tax=Rhodobacter sp. 24-YEA-8 TaxID=1884310 RepID=UPI00115FD126|nr:hypothetical protein [Rhodobacter sp. 24-YEA-8]
MAEMSKPRLGVWPPFRSIAARDDFFDAVFGSGKALSGAQGLAGNRRDGIGFRGQAQMRIQHNQIDQLPRHADIIRAHGHGSGSPRNLGDHQPAIIAGCDRLLPTARIGPPNSKLRLLFVSKFVVRSHENRDKCLKSATRSRRQNRRGGQSACLRHAHPSRIG